jgi:lipopolysaccharide transport system permease protein
MSEALSSLSEAGSPAPIGSFERVLEPRTGIRDTLRLGELWSYRELLGFLTWRDVKVRYRQTAVGALWALLQPFALMVVFTIFLNRIAHVPSSGLPYPLFAYAGLVPWTLFAQSLGAASESLVSNSSLISKVYFPRLVIPLAATGSFLVDFVIAFALLVGMMLYYGVYPGLAFLAAPAFALLALMTAVAAGLWLAALNVRYRDVKYTVPFLLQMWLFASPIAYAASLVPHRWQLVYNINPIATVIDGFRWAALGVPWSPGKPALVSLAVVAVLLVSGLLYFRRTERFFADVI